MISVSCESTDWMMSLTWGERAVGKKRTRKGAMSASADTLGRSSNRGLTGKPVIEVFSKGIFWQVRDSCVWESVMMKWSLGERDQAELTSMESVMTVMMGTRGCLPKRRSTM